MSVEQHHLDVVRSYLEAASIPINADIINDEISFSNIGDEESYLFLIHTPDQAKDGWEWTIEDRDPHNSDEFGVPSLLQAVDWIINYLKEYTEEEMFAIPGQSVSYEARYYSDKIEGEWKYIVDDDENPIIGNSRNEVLQATLDVYQIAKDGESEEFKDVMKRVYIAKIETTVDAELVNFDEFFHVCPNCDATHQHGTLNCECGTDIGGP